jgi:hypothetical protein
MVGNIKGKILTGFRVEIWKKNGNEENWKQQYLLDKFSLSTLHL